MTQSFTGGLRIFGNNAKTCNANAANLTLSGVTFKADSMTAGQIHTSTLTGMSNGCISGAGAVKQRGAGTTELNAAALDPKDFRA